MTDTYEAPDSLLYTKEHEWAKAVGDKALVGVTDYAARTLNDIVYVSLPTVGQSVKQATTFGSIESIKAVSELYSPLSGTVTKVNTELPSHPELVNASPYGEGWIMEINPANLEAERDSLLNAHQYQNFLSSIKK